MTAHPEDVRVLVALTNLLLSHLAELRRLQADSQTAAGPVTELQDQVATRTEQTVREVKSAYRERSPQKATHRPKPQQATPASLGEEQTKDHGPGASANPGTNGIPARDERADRRGVDQAVAVWMFLCSERWL